ncbi:triacylglycerol lipase [Strigomonas culicis]|uniref:Triacylglycerol lipase n=1 Tax=Strigomonas culicis TaxID=28005 RepID=S9TCM1_9TRYP|nr:triacylglycerol lipase [Strigomonas culicis]|eukprot:EPY15777.1 triacylglycerol lipase [Strigomonas culicis]
MEVLTFVLTAAYSLGLLFLLLHVQHHGAPVPSPANDTFNVTEANFSLHLCKAAYCRLEDLAAWSCGPSCDLYPDVEVFNVYANDSLVSVGYSAVSHREERILFAFRGTSCVTNWLSDLTFWHMPYPRDGPCGANCTVHRGFYLTYESIMPLLLLDALVLRALYPTYRVLVTGHSLGGALATLCAADLLQLYAVLGRGAARRPDVQLYTFGAPRVGNDAFVRWLAGALPAGGSYRVTHRSDAVPHLPPQSWGYVHLPREVWFTDGLEPPEDARGYRVCADDAAAEDPTCSDSTWATSVADHLSYLDVCTMCRCDDPPPPPDEVRDPAVLAALREDLAYARTRGKH